jgi:hypothetical protein
MSLRRWHEDEAVTRREWLRHRRGPAAYNMRRGQGDGPGQQPYGSDPREVDCTCDDQPGRFRKRRGRGCGRARCQVCHGYKFPKREPTGKEREADRVFREQLRERREEQADGRAG